MDYKDIVPSADQGGLNELTSFNIRDCKDLEYLIDTTQEQGPHSAAAFCNLVILTLTNMICLKELCHGRFPNGFLQKLEILTILECNNLIVAIPDLPNIKEVSVEDCAGLEVVFQINGLLHASEENQTSMLSSLTNLELDSLPELKHIWKGPPHLVKLQSLEVIRIVSCDKLASLFPATIAQSLVHLEELHIHDCSELEHIITEAETDNNEIVSNTHLHPLCWPKLRTLDISNCPRLRYVFPTFVSECLPRLEVLCLKDLAQLKQVFSPAKERDGNNILLKLLALQELSVQNCPQLTCFIVQDQIKELSLSKLGNSSQLCISTNCSQDYIAVGNHEEVFQVQGEYSFSSLNVLHLEDLSEVRLIWKDVPQVVTLENLTTLNVIDCKRLSYIFSPTTARGLSQLVCLNIQQCDKLDRIIAEDQVCSSSNADLQPISFPNLTTISVGFCKKLKSLFPLGSVRCLPKLEKLIVERNSELEQVFELEDEAEVIIKKEIKFDQLEELSLQEQPSLIDFCPSGYHFVLPDLKCLMVTKCPKMTTCFFIDSEYSVHAKAETPGLVEQNTTEKTAAAQNTAHTENIFWYGQEGVLLPYMEES